MALTIAHQQFIQRDLTQVFRESYLGAANPIYGTFSTIVPSMGADESYAWAGALPGMREWIGDRKFKQIRSAGFVLPNKHWESSLEFERTLIDDDRYAVMRPAISRLAEEARFHPDELLFEEVVNTGESNVCWDGQNFFDTDHLWGDSGTQSNIVTIAGVGDVNALTPEEWKSGYHAAIERLLSFKNDQGKYLNRPTALTSENIVAAVPLSMHTPSITALAQNLSVESAATGVAATSNVIIAQPRRMTVPYLGASSGGSDTSFDVYAVDGEMKPYVFQDRSPLRFQLDGFDDIEGKMVKAMTEARYNIGYLAWWKAIRVKFTA